MANKQKKQQKKQQPASAGNKAKSQPQQQKKAGSAGTSKSQSTAKAKKTTDLEFPLRKENFILMAVGFVIIIIGYILMSGDENIYDFRKTTLAVIVVMFGYAFEVYAILKTPKARQKPEEEEEQSQSDT